MKAIHEHFLESSSSQLGFGHGRKFLIEERQKYNYCEALSRESFKQKINRIRDRPKGVRRDIVRFDGDSIKNWRLPKSFWLLFAAQKVINDSGGKLCAKV